MRKYDIRIKRGQQRRERLAGRPLGACPSVNLVAKISLRAKQSRTPFRFGRADPSRHLPVAVLDAGFTSREVNDGHTMPLVGKSRKRAATTRLGVVRVSSRADDVQFVRGHPHTGLR